MDLILRVSSSFSFRNYDAYHGEILLNTESAKGITPLLTGKAGGIVLGVDYSRRIVYIGDTWLGILHLELEVQKITG